MTSSEIQLPELYDAYGTRKQVPVQYPKGMPHQPSVIPSSTTYLAMTITHIKNAIPLPGGIIIAKNKILIDSFASD